MEKVRIKLDNISKSYYSETAVTQALRKINLSFSVGEFVAITGESGSGKSTLLNIIGGMDTFDDGEMYIDGEPTFQYDDNDWEEYRRSKIGYVFQDYSLIGNYTVLDNMLSALLIMGYDKAGAREIALDYLKQVGLEGYENHKARELSSGQKQRLSIARALAKNTGIIVADEPTGNLDSETGNQIIKLLKELSKNRLVIMVTHNYDQTEKYVTRKIRIHDGEVISDVAVNANEPCEEKETAVVKKNEKGGLGWQCKLALYFAGRNVRTLPGRTLLFTIFLLAISLVSFVFIGELYMNADDIFTKSYSQKGFYHEDETRLVVKKADGSAITQEDVAKMAAVKNVVTVDSCDFANDINFYIKEDRDYEYLYGRWRRGQDREPSKTVSFLNEEHFVMSTDCISESDLAAGRMPQSRTEIVMYSADESIIGTDILCYFTAANIWDTNEYYQTNLTVVGLLKEETEQVYFTREMCQMLSMDMDSGVYRLYYAYNFSKGDYEQKPRVVPIISDDLTGNEVRISKKFDNPVQGEVLFRFQDWNENGELSEEYVEQNVNVLRETHESTSDFLEVSEEFYYTYYNKDSYQASVYITSYAKTVQVIEALHKLGYEAMSTYQVSATDYIEPLVYERLTIIGISAGGLLALLLAQVLILRSLMKIKIKDYFVLKFIGMKMQVIKKISYFEIYIYCGIAVALTILIMWGLRLAGVGIICDMMWYYEIGEYLVFSLYNFVLATLTVASFNHLLKGRLNA